MYCNYSVSAILYSKQNKNLVKALMWLSDNLITESDCPGRTATELLFTGLGKDNFNDCKTVFVLRHGTA